MPQGPKILGHHMAMAAALYLYSCGILCPCCMTMTMASVEVTSVQFAA